MRDIRLLIAGITLFALVKCTSKSGTANIGGKTYKTVKIGQQEWMAENLNLDVGNGCYCYDDNASNCANYGILYTWEAAKRVASEIPGWHLPSNAEWEQLVNYLGGEDTAGKEMKSTTGWDGGGNGTNSSGFNAFPNGQRNFKGRFKGRSHAYFWSATPSNDSRYAWSRELQSGNPKASRRDYFIYRENAYSVRLVRD